MIALGLNLYTEAASAKFNLEADGFVAKWLCIPVKGWEGWKLGVRGWGLEAQFGG